MLNWIVIGMLIVLFLIALRFKHLKQKAFLIAIILLALFFYISASKVIKTESINLKTFDGVVSAGRIYFNWLIHLGGNVKTLGGQAIKMDWVWNETIK